MIKILLTFCHNSIGEWWNEGRLEYWNDGILERWVIKKLYAKVGSGLLFSPIIPLFQPSLSCSTVFQCSAKKPHFSGPAFLFPLLGNFPGSNLVDYLRIIKLLFLPLYRALSHFIQLHYEEVNLV